MDKKLLLTSINKNTLRSLYKAGMLSFALFLVSQFSFSWLSLAVFAATAAYCYGTVAPEERRRFTFSFISVLMLGIGGLYLFSNIPLLGTISNGIIFTFGVFMFILMSFIHFVFRDEVFVYALFHTLLLFLITLFSRGVSHIHPILGTVGFLILVILLFKEFFSFSHVLWAKRAFLASAVAAFLGYELFVAGSLLPLQAVHHAALVTAFLFLLRDVMTAHFFGRLTISFIFEHITFFVLVVLIIFATTQWNI